MLSLDNKILKSLAATVMKGKIIPPYRCLFGPYLACSIHTALKLRSFKSSFRRATIRSCANNSRPQQWSNFYSRPRSNIAHFSDFQTRRWLISQSRSISDQSSIQLFAIKEIWYQQSSQLQIVQQLINRHRRLVKEPLSTILKSKWIERNQLKANNLGWVLKELTLVEFGHPEQILCNIDCHLSLKIFVSAQDLVPVLHCSMLQKVIFLSFHLILS